MLGHTEHVQVHGALPPPLPTAHNAATRNSPSQLECESSADEALPLTSRNSPSQLECDESDDDLVSCVPAEQSVAASETCVPLPRTRLPGPAGALVTTADNGECEEVPPYTGDVAALVHHQTFQITPAWEYLTYELDILRTPQQFDIRTVVSEIRQAQAQMPFFELGHRGGAYATSLIRLPPERPFLALRICEIVTSTEDGNMLCEVEDETGKLEATISAEVLREYSERVQVGTCLAVKQPPMPGGLFFPICAWSHHLIVTMRGLVLLRGPHDPPPPPPQSPLTSPPGPSGSST